MGYRGFDYNLAKRVADAGGFYFTDATLKWWDAYGGDHATLERRHDPEQRLTVVVESVQNHYDNWPREYRYVAVLFTPKPTGGESVDVFKPEDNGAHQWSTGATATRHMRAWLAKVAERIDAGETLDAAVRKEN